MKKLLITAGLLATVIIAYPQAAGNAIYSSINNNYNAPSSSTGGGVDLTLSNYNSSFSSLLEANVMINVKSASYVAIFSLTQHSKTIEEAENNMLQRTELFKKTLAGDGGNWQVFVDPVALIPTYETEITEKKFSKTLNEIPTGFEIKKNVHITFKEHDQVNRLITLAAKAEIYDMVKVDYMVDNMDVILDQLRQEALRILLQKKEVIEHTGIHIRFKQVGEKYGSVYPMERYAQYYAYKTGIAPAFTVNYKKGQPQQAVHYNYAEKNKTIYYEEVSDKQFDKVINPVVGEPEVQVYLTLKGQYEIYDPITEKANRDYNEKMKAFQVREMELNLEAKKKDIELKGNPEPADKKGR